MTGVTVSCGVAVGGFTPLKVGVIVNVRVGVTGVAVGMGVYVIVDVGAGVPVGTGIKKICSSEQAEIKTASMRVREIFFMVWM
jgi:hypothetical protein